MENRKRPVPSHQASVDPEDLDSSKVDNIDLTVKSEVECRKCGHTHKFSTSSCHRCGLNFAFANRLPTDHKFDGLPKSKMGQKLREEWQSLAQSPHNTDAHRKFISRCNQLGQLSFAGHCYRKACEAASSDADRQVFEVYRKQVLSQAAFLLPVSNRAESASANYKWITWSIAALLILGFAVLFVASTKQAVTLF